MATADGAMSFDDDQERTERSDVTEPTVLPTDFPGPVRWDSILGPGGEDLGDGLVPLDGGPPPAAEGPGGRRRPRLAATRMASWLRGLPTPTVGGMIAAIVATGFVGLAAALVAVLFVFDGAAPAARDGAPRATPTEVPASTRPDTANRTDASAERQDQVERGVRRDRAVAPRKRAPAKRPDGKRRAQAAPKAAPVTTRVVVRPPPAPEPAADPWSGVSPAEREFTPGPWNLS